MNVLLLSPRFPWPPYTGDRLRATIWLDALARIGNVTLIAPPGRAPQDVRFMPASRSLKNIIRARSINTLLAAPFD